MWFLYLSGVRTHPVGTSPLLPAGQAAVDEAHTTGCSRESTNLSFALVIVTAGLAAALRFGGLQYIVLVSTQSLLYAVLSRVAASEGIRFVTTMLAGAAASV